MRKPTDDTDFQGMIDFYKQSPEEAAESHNTSVDDLYSKSLWTYLSADSYRHEQGFRSLWGKWRRGKSNMPLSVETAIDLFYAGA